MPIFRQTRDNYFRKNLKPLDVMRNYETMQWPLNKCLIAYKSFRNFHRIRPFLLTNVGKMLLLLACAGPFRLVLVCYQPAQVMWYITLTPQALVRIYQAKHSSLQYKYNILHCIAFQIYDALAAFSTSVLYAKYSTCIVTAALNFPHRVIYDAEQTAGTYSGGFLGFH